MHRDNVRAVLLENSVDPAIVESEIERFMNQPSRLKLPSAEELAAMYGRQD